MGTIIVSTDSLAPGDVLLVAIELTDRTTGQPFWWKRFTCVTRIKTSRFATLLTLKMHPDLDKDVRDVDLHEARGQVIEKLDESEWPQGVVAMRMKHIATGLIDLAPF